MVRHIDCSDQECGFSVSSNDDDELVSVIRRHAREKHDMDLGQADARDMIQD